MFEHAASFVNLAKRRNLSLTSDGVRDFSYDDEGNRTAQERISTASVPDKRIEYTWDHRQRLTRIATKNNAGTITHDVLYVYDVFNRRIEKEIDLNGATSGGVSIVHYVYDQEHIALAFNGDNDLTNRYLHNPDITDQVYSDEQFDPALDIATGTTAGNSLWALPDNQGSTRDLVENDGDVVNHITYNVFGGISSETATSVNFAFGYTSRETDEESLLNFYRARYYDTLAGRFISEDPAGYTAGDSHLNRYTFNNPTNATDPTGRVTLGIGGDLDGALGFVHASISVDLHFGWEPGWNLPTIGLGIGGGVHGGLGIGVGANIHGSATTADHVGDLGGTSTGVGVFIPVGGVEIYGAGGDTGYTGITVGTGPAPGIGVYVGDTHSAVINTAPDPTPQPTPSYPGRSGNGGGILNQGP